MSPLPCSVRKLLPVTLLACSVAAALAAENAPKEWIEPQTGHRVVRLSEEPGSASLYFHQNAYSPDGRKLLITTPKGIATVELATRRIDLVVPNPARVLMLGRKSGRVYFTRDRAVWSADLETHEARELLKLPAELEEANIAVNSDETLIVGTAVDKTGKAVPRTLPPGVGEQRLAGRWAQGLPMVIYTVDLATGELKKIHRENDWTNHLQCSPTDPHQILFCHEGPWHFNDRTWTLRTDGTGLTQVHPRTMQMEIAGHEFFSADGETVWYDLQTPRSLVFWLAGYNLKTGERTWYHLERNEWSVHYNVSPDGTLFAGDGGGPTSVANRTVNGEPMNPPGNGQWIYLFRPVAARNQAAFLPGQDKLIHVGVFQSERLVDLSKHDYHLEPNVTFTPDGKWLVFRSNMHGASHVYAVEIAKAER